MSQITIKARATIVVTIDFTDEEGVAVVPNEITWTLSDGEGNIINNREEVEVASPASSIAILLTGDDTPAGTDSKRIIKVRATYESAMLPGVQAEIIEEGEFYVDPTTIVSV
jgi:predicted NAD/FAD-dependent oxidoreductase